MLFNLYAWPVKSLEKPSYRKSAVVLQNLTTNKGIVSCSNSVWLLHRSGAYTCGAVAHRILYISLSTSVGCSKPEISAETEWPSSSESSFTIKQKKPAEECNGSDRKLVGTQTCIISSVRSACSLGKHPERVHFIIVDFSCWSWIWQVIMMGTKSYN